VRNRVRVREGDTLESIAARCEVDVDQIIELNPGIDPLALTPGQIVRIRPPAT
jgi:LysM repeat protein